MRVRASPARFRAASAARFVGRFARFRGEPDDVAARRLLCLRPEWEVTLVEDGGETLLRAGDCAAFPKGTGNGHHLINRSSAIAVYLEVGSRHPDDLTTC